MMDASLVNPLHISSIIVDFTRQNNYMILIFSFFEKNSYSAEFSEILLLFLFQLFFCNSKLFSKNKVCNYYEKIHILYILIYHLNRKILHSLILEFLRMKTTTLKNTSQNPEKYFFIILKYIVLLLSRNVILKLKFLVQLATPWIHQCSRSTMILITQLHSI